MPTTSISFTSTTQKHQESDRASIPTLWVDSIDGLPTDRLAQHFQLLTPNDEPESGYHIIALTGERAIRKQIKKVRGVAQEITVFPSDLLPFELPIHIAVKAQPLEYWYKGLKDEPLELEDALDIARDTLTSFQAGETSSKQKNIELEELRQRCRMTSSFDWNRFIQDRTYATGTT